MNICLSRVGMLVSGVPIFCIFSLLTVLIFLLMLLVISLLARVFSFLLSGLCLLLLLLLPFLFLFLGLRPLLLFLLRVLLCLFHPLPLALRLLLSPLAFLFTVRVFRLLVPSVWLYFVAFALRWGSAALGFGSG